MVQYLTRLHVLPSWLLVFVNCHLLKSNCRIYYTRSSLYQTWHNIMILQAWESYVYVISFQKYLQLQVNVSSVYFLINKLLFHFWCVILCRNNLLKYCMRICASTLCRNFTKILKNSSTYLGRAATENLAKCLSEIKLSTDDAHQTYVQQLAVYKTTLPLPYSRQHPSEKPTHYIFKCCTQELRSLAITQLFITRLSLVYFVESA